MSHFSITVEQRRRLLEGDYSALDFDIKPHGCEKGACYVLDTRPERRIAIEDNDGNFVGVHVVPAHPVWWITVTIVQRHRKGFWRVKFDVHDFRDPTLWLKPCGGYQASAMGAVDSRPVVVDESVRAKVKEEAEHLRRLCEETQRARSRARRQRAA